MSTFTNSILVTGDVIADTDIYVGQRVLASSVAAEARYPPQRRRV